MLERGQKLHVITRRTFRDDLRRHFAGKVLDCTDMTVKLEGYVFVLDPVRTAYVKRPERRIRIVSLVDAANIIVQMPDDVDLDALNYEFSPEKRLIVTDGAGFRLDINEFGAKH